MQNLEITVEQQIARDWLSRRERLRFSGVARGSQGQLAWLLVKEAVQAGRGTKCWSIGRQRRHGAAL